jgi:hypothetical protein
MKESLSLQSSVYILVDTTNKRLKIGKANNVASRSKAFSDYSCIDYANSLEFICRDERSAYLIEKMLHARFDDHKIPKQDIGNVDGRNEWFKISIQKQLVPFLGNDERILTVVKGVCSSENQEDIPHKYYYSTVEGREIKRLQKKRLKEDIVEEILGTLGNLFQAYEFMIMYGSHYKELVIWFVIDNIEIEAPIIGNKFTKYELYFPKIINFDFIAKSNIRRSTLEVKFNFITSDHREQNPLRVLELKLNALYASNIANWDDCPCDPRNLNEVAAWMDSDNYKLKRIAEMQVIWQ